MLTWTSAPVVGAIAVGIGYAVGRIAIRWQTWTGYVGLLIVALLVTVVGLDPVETAIDCLGLAIGFATARR